MPSTILNPYFFAGLFAAIFFVLTLTLVGLSLFAIPAEKKKLLLTQSFTLGFATLFLIWLSWDMWEQLQALRAEPEPLRTQIGTWSKHLLSVLLLGIAVVFGSLITCFGWVRAGEAGNGVRSVVWALIGLKVVISATAMIDFLARASSNEEDMIPDGELAAEAVPLLDAIEASLSVWIWIVVTMVALSIVASGFVRKGAKA